MKILNSIFAVCVALASITVCYASPLIFKVSKEVTNTSLVELGNFDASKYRQVRVAVTQTNISDDTRVISKLEAEVELNAAKREVERQKKLVEDGLASRYQYDASVSLLKSAQLMYDIAVEKVYPPISIYGIEGTEEILIASFDGKSLTNSILIDSPPAKISIKVFGRGTYKVFAWASL